MKTRFTIGDEVKPTSEWSDTNCIPFGRVRKVELWGNGTVIFIEGDHRGFVDYVFERDSAASFLAQPDLFALAQAANSK